MGEEVGAAWARLISSVVAFGLYFAFSLGGQSAKQTLPIAGRTTVAALSLGLFLLLLRHIELIPLLAGGALLYLVLLFLLRIVSYSDLLMLQRVK